MTTRVAIVHPWFPQYRLPFFDELIRSAAEATIELDVYHGDPPPEWGERGDSITASYSTALPTRFLPLGGRSLAWKSPWPLLSGPAYDLVVVEQAVRNLETYVLLLAFWGRVAFWGHGRTYTAPVGRVQEWFKAYLTRRGSWFFAYTGGGARAVVDAGFPPDRTTTVENATDTGTLRRDIRHVTEEQRQRFRRRHGLTERTALYIGGLDESKRLGFLLEAARHCHDWDDGFRLVLAGNGSQRRLVEEAARKADWVTYLGPIFGHDKAVAMAAARVLLVPGRVGLVAVDSFASGLPVVTTSWPWHAPEFEYLVQEENALIVDGGEHPYARCVVDLLRDETRLRSLSDGARRSADQYTVENMAAKFLQGIQDALAAGAR